jgi:hypothetical protein
MPAGSGVFARACTYAPHDQSADVRQYSGPALRVDFGSIALASLGLTSGRFRREHAGPGERVRRLKMIDAADREVLMIIRVFRRPDEARSYRRRARALRQGDHDSVRRDQAWPRRALHRARGGRDRRGVDDGHALGRSGRPEEHDRRGVGEPGDARPACRGADRGGVPAPLRIDRLTARVACEGAHSTRRCPRGRLAARPVR